jgi:Tfp pilus assembly protein PilF
VAAAKASLEEAERLEPELGGIFIARAMQAMYAGQFQQALDLCEEAARRDPSRHTVQSWTLRAKIYERMGRPAEAQAALQRARAAGSP